MVLYTLQDVQRGNKDEKERTQTKHHTWTFATQPYVVELISVPVIIEASAPVVPCGRTVPRSGSAACPVSWQIVYSLSRKLSLFYFDIYTLITCPKVSFYLG